MLIKLTMLRQERSHETDLDAECIFFVMIGFTTHSINTDFRQDLRIARLIAVAQRQ